MDQQNIDRLFREKLGQVEVIPSANAWSRVEKQIRRKKTPVIYWVAASVSLLFIFRMIWPDASQQELTPIASEINHPVYQSTPDFAVPVLATEKENEEQVKVSQKVQQKTRPQVQFAINKSEDKKAEISEDVTPATDDIATKTMIVGGELAKPEIMVEIKDVVERPEFRAVKITYIASSGNSTTANSQKNDSTGVLKKFIAFTEKIDPGDMLADIKTAKDNLLNGGFKSKKNRNSF